MIAALLWRMGLFLVIAASASGFEGFGAKTQAGERGELVVVTSLDDSGPGTLREALTHKSQARIQFAVGGTIKLERGVSIKGGSFVTIDGSSAPPPGITLRGDALRILSSHDVVVTHLRVRDSRRDGITIKDSDNVLIDHCSLTDAGDENLSITRGATNVTVSWCLIGETRPPPRGGGKGVLVADIGGQTVTNVSIHHNLFARLAQRSPQISTAGLFDLRNNVIRNWESYGIRIRKGGFGNIVGNVLGTEDRPSRAVILTADSGRVYLEGNRSPHGLDVNLLRTAPKPLRVAPVATDSVEVVEQKVLKTAGAFPRDETDRLLVSAAPPKPPQKPGRASSKPAKEAGKSPRESPPSGIPPRS